MWNVENDLWITHLFPNATFDLWKTKFLSTSPCGEKILDFQGFAPSFHRKIYYYLLLLYLFFLSLIKNRNYSFSNSSTCGKMPEVFYEIYL